MKKLMTLILLLTAAFALTTCGSTGTTPKSGGIPYTGDGGKGTSIAILPPQGVGLSKDLDYLPALIQGEFVSNFSGYSAINVLDRVALESQYAELLSGYYPDDAEGVITLGHLPPTTYLMMGKITKTSSGYALQITVAKNADGATAAAYSGTCTVAELDNLTGIRRSSQELLEKMGVELNTQAKTELAGSAREQSVNAQTALAKGITAQKSGTTVETMAYYYQAAAYDPSLAEAVSRASVMTANITSGNIGQNVRNDIAWRNAWIERLTETENFLKEYGKTFNKPNPSYDLVYSTNLQTDNINYKNSTVSISFDMELFLTSPVWFTTVEKVVNTVMAGLKATGRAKDWNLDMWPYYVIAGHSRVGYTGYDVVPILEPRNSGPTPHSYSYTIVVELVNEQGVALGTQRVTMDYGYNVDLYGMSAIFVVVPYLFDSKTVTFPNVKADLITDKLTIRIVSMNGVAAETAGRDGSIMITTKEEYDRAPHGIATRESNFYGFKDGRIITYLGDKTNLVIPPTLYGIPVTSIGQNAFDRFPSVPRSPRIPKEIRSGIRSDGTLYIRNYSFTDIIIPNSVTDIWIGAFHGIPGRINITIPANVTLHRGGGQYGDYTDYGFWEFYIKNRKRAGTYTGNTTYSTSLRYRGR